MRFQQAPSNEANSCDSATYKISLTNRSRRKQPQVAATAHKNAYTRNPVWTPLKTSRTLVQQFCCQNQGLPLLTKTHNELVFHNLDSSLSANFAKGSQVCYRRERANRTVDAGLQRVAETCEKLVFSGL